MKELIAGIDIGGTKIAVAVASTDQKILANRTFPTKADDGPHKIIEEILDNVEELVEKENGYFSGIGIGCCGPVDLSRGLVLSTPNLPGWNDFPIVEIVRRRMNVPVFLDNDANAAALGEQLFGAGKKFKNIV